MRNLVEAIAWAVWLGGAAEGGNGAAAASMDISS
jgi:hypothetical protein